MNFQLVVDSHCDNLFAFFEGDKNEGIWLVIKSLKKKIKAIFLSSEGKFTKDYTFKDLEKKTWHCVI